MFFTTRNRERMTMIEKGMEVRKLPEAREKTAASPRPRQKNGKFLLKVGMLFVGILGKLRNDERKQRGNRNVVEERSFGA